MNRFLIGSADVYEDEHGNLQVDQSSIQGVDDDDDDDPEFGRRGRRTRGQRRGRRRRRQDFRRQERRTAQDQRAESADEPPVSSRGPEVNGAHANWAKTIISNGVTNAAAGSGVIQIRLQHDFLADDLTFEGSATGAKVTSIQFGDQNVFTNPNGVPVSIFAVGGQMRDYLKGRSIKAGLDITINVTTANASETVTATLTGKKPALSGC